jgi:hypothetical protein
LKQRYALPLVLTALMIAPVNSGFRGVASAQEVIVPAPDPVTGPPPAKPDDTQQTYDEVSIRQLMKIVSLSRLFAGGLSQLFGAAQGQRNLLDLIRGAQMGPKEFPLLNGPDEVEERSGGRGLKEMADGLLNGAPEGPPGIIEALNQLQTTFKLDSAFALKNDELLSKKMLAQLAAKGAVAASSAENSYKRANFSNARLEKYITAVKESPDLKTSVDINTRVMIEVAQQSNEAIRTQSAIASIISTYFMVLSSEASEKSWVDGLKNFNR